MKRDTITLQQMRSYVEQGVEFRGTNNVEGTNKPTIWAEWREYGPYNPTNVPIERCYCVFSYSYSWPLLVFSNHTNTWYGNDERYSNTTTRHMSHAKPYEKEVLMVGRNALYEMVGNGTIGTVRRKIAEA